MSMLPASTTLIREAFPDPAVRARTGHLGGRGAVGASFVQLDVTDDTSVAATATVQDRSGHLDILINNAGILGDVTAPADMTVEQLRTVYETNLLGVVRVTSALLPVLRPYPLAAYASSKTAVAMLTMQYAKTTSDVRFNAVDPGQTATEDTGHLGHSVEEGANAAVPMATLASETPTGTVTDRDGALPW